MIVTYEDIKKEEEKLNSILDIGYSYLMYGGYKSIYTHDYGQYSKKLREISEKIRKNDIKYEKTLAKLNSLLDMYLEQ
jgi:hypothetical protein